MNKPKDRSRSRALLEAARSMSTAQNLEELLIQILEQSRDVMDCEVCSILIPERHDSGLVIRSTRDSLDDKPMVVPKGKGIASEVFETRRTINITDADRDRRHFTVPQGSSELVSRAMLTIPILEGERCLGVMQAINPNSEAAFGAGDEEIFETFGSLISVTLLRLEAQQKAIREAELQQELTLAKEIQSSFLPAREIRHGPIDVKIFYEQASEIGGDFYFWHLLDDGKLLLGIADVCGKGLPAALDMARGATMIASIAHQAAEMPLGDWVSELNTRLCSVMNSGRFIAATTLLFDPKHNKVQVSEAGLPAAKIFDGKSWSTLEIPGNPPLGISSMIDYQNVEYSLDSARDWLIFSDGILEVQNPDGEHFEDKAFCESLATTAAHGNNGVLKHLSEDWKKFAAGSAYQDDTTVMTITNLAIPPAPELRFKCDAQATCRGRDFVESWASYCGFTEEEAGLMILGCDEAFTNLIKHAYEEKDADISSVLRAATDGDSLQLILEHKGEGISNEEFKTLMNPPACDEKIGGLGMFVMQEVFDSIDFQKGDETCTITLTKSRNPNQG